ncbi:MAG: YqeG family HAD IIIA-type phosphatase [Cyanobacteria bacterium P01_H01_bin.74]
MFIRPTCQLSHVAEITPGLLNQLDVHGLLLDLDNTLMIPRLGDVPASVSGWLKSIQDHGIACIILSNNTDTVFCEKAQEKLGLQVIGSAQKPNTALFQVALQYLNMPPAKVAMVGDRVLTDIWVGQKMQAKTILVSPLLGKKEQWQFRFLRLLESLLCQLPAKQSTKKQSVSQ